MGNKKCTGCGDIKDFNCFYAHPTGYFGLQSLCVECYNEANRKRNKTQNGVVSTMYFSQRQTSKRRGHPYPKYTLDELKKWVFSQDNWLTLYNNWVKSGYQKNMKPSCDRTDDLKPYCLSRLILTTWIENKLKGENDRRAGGIDKRNHKPVIGTCIKTGKIIKFGSAVEAEKIGGFGKSCVSACCIGKQKTSRGYSWRYA